MAQLFKWATLVWGLASHGAIGDVIVVEDNLAKSIRAGFYCLSDPDDKVAAPDSSTGELNVYNEPFHFVHLGDTVPSIPGIGIGAVVEMNQFDPSEQLAARAIRKAPGERFSSWPTATDARGVVWLGWLGSETDPFPPGVWRFEIMRTGQAIFSYEFTVVDAAEVPELLAYCTPSIS